MGKTGHDSQKSWKEISLTTHQHRVLCAWLATVAGCWHMQGHRPTLPFSPSMCTSSPLPQHPPPASHSPICHHHLRANSPSLLSQAWSLPWDPMRSTLWGTCQPALHVPVHRPGLPDCPSLLSRLTVLAAHPYFPCQLHFCGSYC